MLTNNLISFCEGYSNKRYFRTKLDITMFQHARVSSIAKVNPVKPVNPVNRTIYGKFISYLGRFDDLSCRRHMNNTVHICERAESCTKHERGRSLFVKESVLEDQEHALSVFLLVMGYHERPNRHPFLSYHKNENYLRRTATKL